MKKCVLIMMMLAVVAVAHADVIWNFGVGEVNSNPISGLTAGLSGGAFIGVDSGAFNIVSASSGYDGASGAYNAYMSVSSTGSRYWEFAFTPDSGMNVMASSIVLGSRSTSTGPTVVELYSSVDSYSSALVAWTFSADAVWVLGAEKSFNVSGAIDEVVTFRLTPSSASGGNSNWRIDDVRMNIVAVPEPTSLAFLGLGLGVLLTARRRLRKSENGYPRQKLK